ncbi:HPr family phosphocarrier protein [Lacrimispora indolis]|uniref:HPr family phosphocarrier protein n=1 Tax=Lacrimispora indolis TaxID=69825 RepID=UPI0004015AED|nr:MULTISPECIES: HPr family phosphocarrier protein [Lachnospiraceae]MBE7721630.1 HPr family phosphocarrier protein [Lacrimispora celerecrescens]
MKQFEFVVQDAMGIHARSAGDMAAAAKQFTSLIKLKKEEKEADLKDPLAIMRLAIKQEERVIISAAGEDENQAIQQLKDLIEKIGLNKSR